MNVINKALPGLLLIPAIAWAAPMTISLSGLVSVVVYLCILATVCWLLLFIVAKIGPPEPFGKIITAIIYVVAALILIALLLDFAGMPVLNVR